MAAMMVTEGGTTVKRIMSVTEATELARELDALRALAANVSDLRSYLALPKFAGPGNDYVQTADVHARLRAF